MQKYDVGIINNTYVILTKNSTFFWKTGFYDVRSGFLMRKFDKKLNIFV